MNNMGMGMGMNNMGMGMGMNNMGNGGTWVAREWRVQQPGTWSTCEVYPSVQRKATSISSWLLLTLWKYVFCMKTPVVPKGNVMWIFTRTATSISSWLLLTLWKYVFC